MQRVFSMQYRQERIAQERIAQEEKRRVEY
jgi:hypothetical protein